MTEFEWVAIAVVTVVSAARITRFVTFDGFPPMKWVREKYEAKVGEEWGLLFNCGYCFGFWATIGVVAWGYLSGWDTAWWLGNGTLAAAYLAAIVMAFDGDES